MKKKSNLHSCNVLDLAGGDRRLWQFTLNGKAALAAEQKLSAMQPLPSKAVEKNWRTLWQPKLNIAWLPSDQVFLRVIQLPASELSELTSMVEFQLEKLSPLPVNQIVWSIEILPPQPDNLQTVIVIVVARSVVEEFLGALESGGYLPDRLEVPHLHQLLAAMPEGDVVQLFPIREGGQVLSLVAWWTGGVLRNLELLHLTDSEGSAQLLISHLTKTAWAGELEGWLAGPIGCCLIADAEEAKGWKPALEQWRDKQIEVIEPLSAQAIAEMSAIRAAREQGKANLLPPEYSARYRQQFVDRLWMSGLAALTVAYVVGVVIYLGVLQVLTFQKNRVQRELASISGTYTNAVRMSARADVLQTQLNLKYAALDCLRAASEHLPGELTLTLFTFSRGQTLTLQGTAQLGQTEPIFEYSSRLRSATVNGEPLFSRVDVPTYHPQAGNLHWSFTCELNRPGSE